MILFICLWLGNEYQLASLMTSGLQIRSCWEGDCIRQDNQMVSAWSWIRWNGARMMIAESWLGQDNDEMMIVWSWIRWDNARMMISVSWLRKDNDEMMITWSWIKWDNAWMMAAVSWLGQDNDEIMITWSWIRWDNARMMIAVWWLRQDNDEMMTTWSCMRWDNAGMMITGPWLRQDNDEIVSAWSWTRCDNDEMVTVGLWTRENNDERRFDNLPKKEKKTEVWGCLKHQPPLSTLISLPVFWHLSASFVYFNQSFGLLPSFCIIFLPADGFIWLVMHGGQGFEHYSLTCWLLCSAFVDKTVSGAEKRRLLAEACQHHQVMYKDAMNGKAIDRHLFALYVASRGMGLVSVCLCLSLSVSLSLIFLLSLYMHVLAVSFFFLFFSVYMPLTSYLIHILYVLDMFGFFFFFYIFCSLCTCIISRIALVRHGRGLDVKRPCV